MLLGRKMLWLPYEDHRNFQCSFPHWVSFTSFSRLCVSLLSQVCSIWIGVKCRFLGDLRCLTNGQLNLWKCFYILLTVCPQERGFFFSIFFFFSLSFFLCWLFLSLFCTFSLSYHLLNLLPWLQKFCNCKTLSSESPLALFWPHSAACIFTLWYATSSVTRLQRAAEVALHMKRPWEGHRVLLQWVPSATLPCVKLTQPTAERNRLGKPVSLRSRVGMQRAGRVELQRNPSVTRRPEHSSSGPEFGTTLWPFFKTKTKNPLPLPKNPSPRPLSPSAWELLAYFLEKDLKYLVLNFLLDESLKELYNIRTEINGSDRCLSFT